MQPRINVLSHLKTTKACFCRRNKMRSFNLIEKECDFSIPYQSKVILTEETVVLNLCKITEVRKQKIKVEILHDFENNFKILIDFYNNLSLTLFSKNSLLQNNLV